jgi:nucleotide-binding universal stress UspA family protein
MSSHGRGGLMRLALGSVADKVMTLSKVPVMVYR